MTALVERSWQNGATCELVLWIGRRGLVVKALDLLEVLRAHLTTALERVTCLEWRD